MAPAETTTSAQRATGRLFTASTAFELVAEPKRVVGEVYEALGIPLTAGFAALLDQEQARARRHESGHRYSLEEFGLDKDAIEQELAELFGRYHWSEGGPAHGG